MFLKEYKSLVGYLERYTVLKIGRLHIRLHVIKSPDKTPFMHTHPFHYVSVILSGGYTELVGNRLKKHSVGSVIVRQNKTAHRIQSVLPGTVTLFFTWKTPNYSWQFSDELQDSVDEWVIYERGIYSRIVFGKKCFAKFDRFWYIGHSNAIDAENESRPSIDQTSPGIV